MTLLQRIAGAMFADLDTEDSCMRQAPASSRLKSHSSAHVVRHVSYAISALQPFQRVNTGAYPRARQTAPLNSPRAELFGHCTVRHTRPSHASSLVSFRPIRVSSQRWPCNCWRFKFPARCFNALNFADVGGGTNHACTSMHSALFESNRDWQGSWLSLPWALDTRARHFIPRVRTRAARQLLTLTPECRRRQGQRRRTVNRLKYLGVDDDDRARRDLVVGAPGRGAGHGDGTIEIVVQDQGGLAVPGSASSRRRPTP